MKRFVLSWLLTLFALVAATPGFAQLPKLDAFLKGLEEEGIYAGSVLVVRGGSPIFRGDYGFRDEAQTQKNDAASVFYVAEVEETILATLVMMAQERGLVSLDASIGTLLPEFRDKPGPRVQDLLCHAAGFGAYSLDRVKYAESGMRTLAGAAAEIAAEPQLVAPGTRFDWEHKDYAMVGYILETVTGKPLPTVLSEWILQPLKMKKTGAGLYPGGKELAWVSRFTQFQESLAQWKGGYLPSDCVYSTVDELEIFFSALASGKLVSADSYKAMQTALVNDGKDGSGLGIAITPSGAIWEAGHDRGGYRGLFWYDPRYDLRIIMLGNKWMPASGSSINKILCSEIYSALGLKEPA